MELSVTLSHSMGSMATRTAIYARISDDKSGEAAGVGRQSDDCRALCRDRGWKDPTLYEDNDISAFTGKLRPAYEELMQAVDAGDVQRIVVWHMSRLFRNRGERVRGLDRLRAANVAVIAIKGPDLDLSTAAGRMVANVLGEFDTYESEVKSERVARAHEASAIDGKFAGGRRRMGYTKSADALHPEEAAEIQWAYEHVAAGGSLESVGRRWREVLGTGSLGGTITGVTVRDVLLRPMNCGLSFYKGSEVGRMADGVPRLVDEQTWRTVHAILSDPARRTVVGKPPRHLLSGVLRCGKCEGRMGGRYRLDRRKGRKDPIYACRANCMTRHRDRIDEGVTELLLDYLTAHANILRAPTGPTVSGTSAADAADARARLDALSQMFAAGEIDPADYAMASRRVRERLASLEVVLAKSSTRPATAALLAADDLAAAWADSPMDSKRTIVREVIERIVVAKPRPGPFSMAGVEVHWRYGDAQPTG